MKVSVIQPDLIWEDKLSNLEKITQIIFSADHRSEIVILPEMFNTGFSVNPEKLSEAPGSTTFEWMAEMATKGSFAICGSYTVRVSKRMYNRWVFVTPDKKTINYDKRHLFRMGDEEKYFTPGKRRIVFRFRGLRICPNVCYDLRFPVWSRNRNDYDLLINSANWPEARRDVWLTLLKARAIENQCFVAASNRVGTDGKGIHYCGDSMILDPKGNLINAAEKDSESIISGELSIDDLKKFRNKFPVSKDADSFTIH